MSYLGRSAKLSLKAQEKVSFLATAGQTVKTGLSYVPNFVEVYVNGILLTDTTDFTATNGNSVTFTVALALNDEVTVVSLKTFTVADHYTKSDANTLLAAKATTANFTSTGIDDNATSTAITIDASENVLVGKSSQASSSSGCELLSNGTAQFTRDGNSGLRINRLTSDGELVRLSKAGTTVGSIQSRSGVVSTIVLDPRSGGAGLSASNAVIIPTDGTGALTNDVMDLGLADYRFKDLYLSGGAYLGGTGSANKLDDYEEGTWTAVIQSFTGTNPTVVYGNQISTYTKIGNTVCLRCEMDISTFSGGTSHLAIRGLPFHSNSGSGGNTGSFTSTSWAWTRARSQLNFINPQALGFLGQAPVTGNGTWAWEPTTLVNNSSAIRFSITYITDS